MKKFLIVLLTVLVVVALTFVGCGEKTSEPPAGEEEPPPGEEEPPPEEEEPAPTPPQPGEWSAQGNTADFAFVFTVNPDSTAITRIRYHLEVFHCGGLAQLEATNLELESIPINLLLSGAQFTAHCSFQTFDHLADGPKTDWDVVIKGRFGETGTHASGTWEISAEGRTCAGGTWEAFAPEAE